MIKTSDDNCFVYIGTYRLTLPNNANLKASLTKMDTKVPNQIIYTHWNIEFKNFNFSIHINPQSELTELKQFINQTTKRDDTEVEYCEINKITSVTHGSYNQPRTWIDWWLKKGKLTLCINLQSNEFPHKEPSKKEIEEHKTLINSIIFIPDQKAKL